MSEPNYAIMRLEKIHSKNSYIGKMKHAMERKSLRHRSHPELEHLNFRQFGPNFRDCNSLAECHEKMMQKVSGKKVRTDAVIGFELVLSASNLSDLSYNEYKKWANTCVKWIKKEFGDEFIYFIQGDFDESNPHLHAFVGACYYNQKLQCYRVSGKHFTKDAERMSQLQDSFANDMEEFGLERGIKKSKRRENKEKHWHIDQRTYWGLKEKEEKMQNQNIANK